MTDQPLAYFITFTTYGAWLHGQAPGSVDDEHNQFGPPFIAANESRHGSNQHQMAQEPYVLDAARREVVCNAIVADWQFRGWTLQALHVRSCHVHLVVS